MPATDSSEPPGSGLLACGSRESGTRRTAKARPASAIGTLMRNTEPHEKWASSRPPTIGPRANPAPLVAAQKPSARWRSASSVNMLVMIESVDGMISAAPIPMPALAAISMPTRAESAAQVDPAANTASPATNVRLRPTRSAMLPATSINPPKTST